MHLIQRTLSLHNICYSGWPSMLPMCGIIAACRLYLVLLVPTLVPVPGCAWP
jgi:hypothetical protein